MLTKAGTARVVSNSRKRRSLAFIEQVDKNAEKGIISQNFFQRAAIGRASPILALNALLEGEIVNTFI